jgi:hypothetical protein
MEGGAMTGDEMERAIEIILHNQADFELQFEKTNRQIEATNARIEILAETQTEFIQITTRHIETQGEINASVRGMLRELKESTLELKRSQTRTDERLDRLAEIVERHIIEGHQGMS